MAAPELTLPPLRARMREMTRRLGLPAFWAWWMRELDAVVPRAPRNALARRKMRPVLAFGADEATLWRPEMVGGVPAMTPATTIPLAGDAAAVAAAGRTALASLAPMVYGGPAGFSRVVVCLPSREVLRKKLVLPAAIEENFRQALAYDLDRHTPFKPDELYFDTAIVDRDGARGTITVDLATVRRSVVDPALRHVAAWGATVVAVVPETPDNAARSRLNLLPAELRPSLPVWRRWQFWVPLALLAAMAVAAVAIPLWQKRDYVRQLDLLTDQARTRAAISETLRAELNTRVGDYNYALERKFAFPSALAVVDAVAKLLPDDTWLTQFELKSVTKGKETQRDLTVRGETANAGKLVQLFEESQFFAQAGQRGPTTKIQPGPGEIFDLGAQVKPRALPAPLALVVADPAAAPAPGAPVAVPPATDAAPPAADTPAPPADAMTAPSEGSARK
ncbi:MAG: PilN domain-containing protein [Burkholderiales bacterium]